MKIDKYVSEYIVNSIKNRAFRRHGELHDAYETKRNCAEKEVDVAIEKFTKDLNEIMKYYDFDMYNFEFIKERLGLFVHSDKEYDKIISECQKASAKQLLIADKVFAIIELGGKMSIEEIDIIINSVCCEMEV